MDLHAGGSAGRGCGGGRYPNPVTPTLAELSAAAAARLATTSDSPRLDAELLLAHALGVPRSRLRAAPESRPDDAAAARFAALLARRVAGEPLAYLLGRREFWSLELEVGPAVLVPRPETETLVGAALQRIPADATVRVLDLGTGSGAIALALKHERPRAQVTAVERSPAALAVAQRNAQRLGLDLELVAGDWFASLGGRRFDAIVSNPPYVASADPHLVALGHEPLAALVAGADGLDDLRRIIAAAPAHLAPDGWLLVEHGADQGPAVRALLAAAGFDGVGTATDGAGRARVGMGTMPPHNG
jgi:release factor glutamine methyltransferase